jgi:hypothetical protein
VEWLGLRLRRPVYKPRFLWLHGGSDFVLVEHIAGLNKIE